MAAVVDFFISKGVIGAAFRRDSDNKGFRKRFLVGSQLSRVPVRGDLVYVDSVEFSVDSVQFSLDTQETRTAVLCETINEMPSKEWLLGNGWMEESLPFENPFEIDNP